MISTAAIVLELAEFPQSSHFTCVCKIGIVMVSPLESFGECILGIYLEQCFEQSKFSVFGYFKNY